MVMTFLVVPLVAAWQPADASPRWLGRWSYPLLFQVALAQRVGNACRHGAHRNLLGRAVGGSRITFCDRFGRSSCASAVATHHFRGELCGALCVAFAQGILRADLLLNLRRFVLTLNSWLLPLLLGFGVAWCVLCLYGITAAFCDRLSRIHVAWVSGAGSDISQRCLARRP